MYPRTSSDACFQSCCSSSWVGGGIAAGVLLAERTGLAWPVTAGLYFISDVILAFAFEPILRLLAAGGRRVHFLAKMGDAMAAAMERVAAHYGGRAAGPFTLVMIAFGGCWLSHWRCVERNTC